MKSINPKITVPMHYRAPGMSATFNSLGTIEDFLQESDNIKKLDGPSFAINKTGLSEKHVIIVPRLG